MLLKPGLNGWEKAMLENGASNTINVPEGKHSFRRKSALQLHLLP